MKFLFSLRAKTFASEHKTLRVKEEKHRKKFI